VGRSAWPSTPPSGTIAWCTPGTVDSLRRQQPPRDGADLTAGTVLHGPAEPG
jgi:hypothetical protein